MRPRPSTSFFLPPSRPIWPLLYERRTRTPPQYRQSGPARDTSCTPSCTSVDGYFLFSEILLQLRVSLHFGTDECHLTLIKTISPPSHNRSRRPWQRGEVAAAAAATGAAWSVGLPPRIAVRAGHRRCRRVPLRDVTA